MWFIPLNDSNLLSIYFIKWRMHKKLFFIRFSVADTVHLIHMIVYSDSIQLKDHSSARFSIVTISRHDYPSSIHMIHQMMVSLEEIMAIHKLTTGSWFNIQTEHLKHLIHQSRTRILLCYWSLITFKLDLHLNWRKFSKDEEKMTNLNELTKRYIAGTPLFHSAKAKLPNKNIILHTSVSRITSASIKSLTESSERGLCTNRRLFYFAQNESDQGYS